MRSFLEAAHLGPQSRPFLARLLPLGFLAVLTLESSRSLLARSSNPHPVQPAAGHRVCFALVLRLIPAFEAQVGQLDRTDFRLLVLALRRPPDPPQLRYCQQTWPPPRANDGQASRTERAHAAVVEGPRITRQLTPTQLKCSSII